MRDRGIGSGGVMGWFFQRLTGIVLVPVLLVHLLTMHRYHDHGLAWEQVTNLMINPYWKALEITFLVLALYHAFNGLYALFQDYVKSSGVRLVLFSLTVLGGLVLFIVGVVTVLSIQSPGLVGTAGKVLP
ncbi:MAG: succinate dehydrogenase, hydrophobic membrane anchor protein [Candidatus Eisenbacteria sp.]|nr:succinate dehydrogenase, hydrophobic membrane anchor protein [Candidatus Eisenbacteria bacterium]